MQRKKVRMLKHKILSFVMAVCIMAGSIGIDGLSVSAANDSVEFYDVGTEIESDENNDSNDDVTFYDVSSLNDIVSLSDLGDDDVSIAALDSDWQNDGNGDNAHLDLGSLGDQREIKLQDETWFEMDKYLSDVTGEKNNQATYDIYLEQALVDEYHPVIITNPAPEREYIMFILDQSSSMASDTRINGMNAASKAFFTKIKEMNEERLENARNGEYSDVNPHLDVEAQMEDHLIYVTGIIGYNNHIYQRYRNVNGLAVTSDAAVNTLYNRAELENDLYKYLRGDKSGDLQEMTRTDLAMSQAQTWINEQADPSRAHLVLVTDGCPTLKDPSWCRDLPLWGGHFNMSSKNTNSSLRTARSLKDAGVIISSLYLGWGDRSLVAKAYETGNIGDVPFNDDCYGIMPIFLSLISSDYPKNGTFGTSGSDFNHTYTYENDSRNQFGNYTFLAEDTDILLGYLEAIATKDNRGSDQPGVTTGYASGTSYIQDVISMPFEKDISKDIKVYKVPWMPENIGADGIPTDMDANNEVSSFRWGRETYIENDERKTEWIDITSSVSVTLTGSTLKVTGFDYEENAVTNYDKDTVSAWPKDNAKVYEPGDYGYKLVVVLPINAKITFGGNNIATNNPDTTQFYPSEPTGTVAVDDGMGNVTYEEYLPTWSENDDLNPDGKDYIEKYPLPIVDLVVTYKIVCDDLIVYAPQTAELHNLVTDENNNLWYVDDTYDELLSAALTAEAEYVNAELAYLLYEQQYSELDNPTDADTVQLLELEQEQTLKLEAYEKALKEFNTAVSYIPDGINNQFVDITYELTDPDGEVVGTMYVPHGKAFDDNIDWDFKDGPNAIVTKSGIYKVSATITPVDTRRAPGGLVYTALDEDAVKQNIGYSSEQYSSTGSTANGTYSPVSMEEETSAYLFQLKVTTTDSQLLPRQALDFNIGVDTLIDGENLHFIDYEWICTDGVTESVHENEPGITGFRTVGSGVKTASQIPVQAEADGLVIDINGTVAVNAPDGGWVPVSVILSRSIGSLNKSNSNPTVQNSVVMTDSDNIWGDFDSVIWTHTCEIITDHDCNDEEFEDAQRYNTSETDGRGDVHYLIHVLDNPMPDVSKTTSTPAITKGEDIKWDVVVSNDNLTENPNRRNSTFSLVDILPHNSDDRIDPATNHENSKFNGELMLKSVVADYSAAPYALAAYQDGTKVMYYTTDTTVRTAVENQILGTAASGNIVWEKATGTVDGTNVIFTIPEDAVAIKLDAYLVWGEKVSVDMVANMVNPRSQKAGDYYHNDAFVLNGNGLRSSEVVVTTVTTLYLSGMVWEDADNNGIATATEKRLNNVVVTLYQPYNPNNPNPVDRTVDGIDLIRAYDTNGDKYPQIATGADGSYKFDDIQPGTYYVVADYIPMEYAVTEKEAGVGNVNTEALDSECEEEFVNNDVMKESTAWITEIVVKDKGVPNQNYGLTLITGNVRVGKTLDEIYYPTTMSDEERADYRVGFVFTLKNKTTGAVYSKSVYMNEDTMHMKDGYPQVWAEFTDLPLGTYELTEVAEASYQISNVTGDSTSVRFNKSTGVTTIPVTAEEHDFEVYVENKMNQDPPGGDENGIKNWINMRVPVKLEVIYVGDDPISSDTLTEYTFVESDFDPAKGGDMIVTYDDGSTISLSNGTLDFADVQLEPATVTNTMNSGDDKITVTGYYAEKGRLLTDFYQVGVDLKPIHKFKINFDANGSKFDDSTTLNSVKYGYDEIAGENFVTSGEYKDVDNDGLNELNGFWFAGWNTKNNGSGIQYKDEEALNAVGKDTNISSLTLYANWKTYVTFDAQYNSTYGGTITGGTTADEKAIVGQKTGKIVVNRNQKISTSLTATKNDWEFVLWNTKKDGSGTNLEDYGPITKPVTFYAIYYHREYYCTESAQTFTAPVAGVYRVQLWGASGGAASGDTAGKGGYTNVYKYFDQGERIYVFVGGNGAGISGNTTGGGYNGGGTALTCLAGPHNGSGGGMSHISTTNNPAVANPDPTKKGTWNPKGTLAVAGGGGGGSQDSYRSGAPGNAGGKTSNAIVQSRSGLNGNLSGATQTSGYAQGVGQSCKNSSGGGGGWWGGYSIASKGSCGTVQTNGGNCGMGGTGGTGYIAPAMEAETAALGYTSSMLGGGSKFENPNGGTETGHSGKGRIRFTLVEMD